MEFVFLFLPISRTEIQPTFRILTCIGSTAAGANAKRPSFVKENNFHTLVFNLLMKRCLSILLSFILLVSHVNVTFGTHFCGGEAIVTKIIFGKTHLGCGMMDMEAPCKTSEKSNSSNANFENAPCCENLFKTFRVTDEYVKEVAFQSLHVEFAQAIIYTTIHLDLFPKSTHQFYTEYTPPPLENDIRVLFQTFLI